MYLLYKGGVAIQKEVTYKSDNRWPEPKSQYTVVTHERTVALHLADLTIGCHFGEEVALGYSVRQYSAVATDKTECFAINKTDILKFFAGNQVAGELRENSGPFYESPKVAKQRHDTQIRQRQLYSDIKISAFGSKYKIRAGIEKTKAKKRHKPGSLEDKIRKLGSINRNTQVDGMEIDGDRDLETESNASPTNKNRRGTAIFLDEMEDIKRLPVLKQSVFVRRETQKQRNLTIRASLMSKSSSLPTLVPDSLKRSRPAIDFNSAKFRATRTARRKTSKLLKPLT